ncbi:DUF2569 domain-containing protein [Vibrio parahaemolyticus]|nr:DUF2569 domain-containing protein [Vibrio parahaemolyticus]ELA8113284.1 DUF2569 domain-containing protein [Vibrio parahaemolyticus]ELA8166940.1 DUF2569 domain-containing protein [Vibrio parahaemolyticus]
METTEVSERSEPLKIGGWLILIAIGVVIAPVRLLYFVGVTYPSIFTDGTWEVLTTYGSEIYSPLWGPIIIGEIVGNLLFAFLGIYLAYLFFTKRSVFPKWYLGLAITSTAFILIDAYLVSIVLPEMEVFDSETTREVARSLFTLCVWSPYLLFAQRSKSTFIKVRT